MKPIFLEKLKRNITNIFIIIIALSLPLYIKNPYHLHIILVFYLNAIVASGLNLVTGLTGQVSIGTAAFIGLGAYTSAIISTTFGVSFWITCILGGIVSAFFGLVIGFPVLRLRGPYLAFATIGFAEIVRLILTNWYSLTKGPMGIVHIPSPTFFGVIKRFSLINWYYLFLFILLIIIYLIVNIFNSGIGRKFKSILDNQLGSALCGVDIAYYKILAFVLCAFIAGIGGSVYAHYFRVISPEIFNFNLSINYVYMIVLGGIGTIEGPILGAAALTIIPEYLRLARDYQMIIVAIIVIIMIVFFPEGLVGIFKKKK